MTYPVHYHIDHPSAYSRVQLLIRVCALLALSVLGISFGSLFVFAYLALPVLAASRIASKGALAYVDEDTSWVLHMLRWFAAASAWIGLAADRLPSREPAEVVRLELDDLPAPKPTLASAIVRVLLGLPSALILLLVSIVGTLVWLWSAVTILLFKRVSHWAFQFLAGMQRWCMRLLCYQASLVDEYPPFSLSESEPKVPHARATA